jgi:hypothetical protein
MAGTAEGGHWFWQSLSAAHDDGHTLHAPAKQIPTVPHAVPSTLGLQPARSREGWQDWQAFDGSGWPAA